MFILLSIVGMGAIITPLQQAAHPVQTGSKITIHVLDGKSGKPISNEHLLIFLTNDKGVPQTEHIDRRTDTDGLVVLSSKDVPFRFIQVWVDWHVLCVKRPNSVVYAISEVLEQGIISQDECGGIKVQPEPGDLYIFARSRHWWEPT